MESNVWGWVLHFSLRNHRSLFLSLEPHPLKHNDELHACFKFKLQTTSFALLLYHRIAIYACLFLLPHITIHLFTSSLDRSVHYSIYTATLIKLYNLVLTFKSCASKPKRKTWFFNFWIRKSKLTALDTPRYQNIKHDWRWLASFLLVF